VLTGHGRNIYSMSETFFCTEILFDLHHSRRRRHTAIVVGDGLKCPPGCGHQDSCYRNRLISDQNLDPQASSGWNWGESMINLADTGFT